VLKSKNSISHRLSLCLYYYLYYSVHQYLLVHVILSSNFFLSLQKTESIHLNISVQKKNNSQQVEFQKSFSPTQSKIIKLFCFNFYLGSNLKYLFVMSIYRQVYYLCLKVIACQNGKLTGFQSLIRILGSKQSIRVGC
jgi:hypothetical protein